MIKDLVKLANNLDSKGLRKEADYLDSLIKKMAQSNPGSAFNAAQRQGAEAGAEASKAELTAKVQKTVDWFNNIVLPDIRSGAALNITVPEDLIFNQIKLRSIMGSSVIIRTYISGGQTIKSLSQKVQIQHFRLGENGKEHLTTYNDLRFTNLGSVYSALEKFVINNNLSVTMESDVSDELNKA